MLFDFALQFSIIQDIFFFGVEKLPYPSMMGILI